MKDKYVELYEPGRDKPVALAREQNVYKVAILLERSKCLQKQNSSKK